MRAAAFFDLDHTLVLGTSTERRFLRRLWRSGEIGPRELVHYLAQFGREPKLSGGFFRRNKAYLTGKPLERLRPLARETIQEALAAVPPRAKECLEGHRSAGRLVVIITGTLDLLAEPLGRSLGAEVIFATRLASRNGCLTGQVLEPYPRGENKRVLVRRLAAERGIDLAASYAYGDEVSDVPMLEEVGHPVAVNPSARMRQVALARGWRIDMFHEPAPARKAERLNR